jgi:general secretion pathway protein G
MRFEVFDRDSDAAIVQLTMAVPSILTRRTVNTLRKQMLLTILVLVAISSAACSRAIFTLKPDSQTKTKIKIAEIDQALDSFMFDVGRYPTENEGLKVLMVQPDELKGWKGPYLRRNNDLLDGWNRAFIYHSPGESYPYKLISYGKDGRPGGKGEDADIMNELEGQ